MGISKKTKAISVKYKALILVMITFIISTSLIVSYAILMKSKEIDTFYTTYHTQISKVYNYWVSHLDSKANMRLNSLANNENIKRYIESKDRESLYKELSRYYKTMTNLNTHIKSLNFYLPNQEMLLRMSDKDRFGDNLSESRPVINEVIKQKKSLSYYEMAQKGLLYKVSTPVIKDNRVIGVIELGIKSSYLLEQIKKNFETEVYFFIRDSDCISDKNSKDSIKIADFRLCLKCSKMTPLIKSIPKEFAFEKNYKFDVKESSYFIHVEALSGYYGVNLANILVIKDVSNKYLALKSFIIFTIAISTIMMVVVFFALNILFNKLLVKLDRFKFLLSESNDLIYIIDPNSGNIVDSNKNGYKFLNLKEKELYKKKLPDIIRCIDNTQLDFDSFLQKLKDKGAIVRRDYIIREDDNPVPVESSINYVKNRKKDGIIFVIRDISQQVKLENELKYIANRDPLTKIYNRRKFYEELYKHFYIAKESNKPLTIMMLDIDHFKSINDTYGHEAGDKTIISIANILLSYLEKEYSVARWGGEEFVMLLPNTTTKEASVIAESIREHIANYKFKDVGDVSSSFGITTLVKSDDVASFTKRVDEALYISKHNGRNRVSIK
jgi:diguanylate cyclase (GGDEF)-like protein/PAS domain S-box-containing protein